MLRYEFRTGVTKQKRSKKIWVFAPLLLLIGGGYMVVNYYSPSLNLPSDGPQDATARKLTTTQPNLAENRLYIPQINVDIAIADGSGNDLMQNSAWHRSPESGDPKSGGNFVLAASRFGLGMTPSQTREKSPLYHMDELSKGDQLYVDYNGTRYAYEVTSKYSPAGSDSSIESRSSSDHMTLFSCDSLDPTQIREVIEAKPVGTIAWVNGIAKLKSPDQL